MRLLRAALRLAFDLLYHAFAWSYDLVAAVVSFGRWNTWVRATQAHLTGKRLLELGPGPGHLQSALHANGFAPVGLDESRQMLRQASRRLRQTGSQPQLARGLAQSLPFAEHAFDGLVATFPSEYIFDPRTLAEARRVLRPGGRLVVLAGAWPAGPGPLRWLARLAGVAEEDPSTGLDARLADPFIQAGFRAEVRLERAKSGTLVFIICENDQSLSEE